MYSKRILSTGVLAKDKETDFAGITLVNLDSNGRRRVSVFVFDWDTGSPVTVPTDIPNPIVLDPNTSVRVTARLDNAFFYEIRIFHPGDRDVLVNCYGVSDAPFINGEGNTVLQHDLVEVELR